MHSFVHSSMATVVEPAFVSGAATLSLKLQSRKPNNSSSQAKLLFYIRASHFQSMDDKEHIYKRLGLFSLKRKIEDAILRVEMFMPPALELEEAKRIQQEELIRECNLWDDPAKSHEILVKLADSVKLVDALKDLKYKAEEAKLISHLAEMDAVNYPLFKQAYSTSLDVSKFLDQYEMSKLLKGPYDVEGACVIIKPGSTGRKPEMWADELVSMYIKWANRLGYEGRLVEKHPSINGGIQSVTIEFEFEFAYGYLLGERGIHHMIDSQHKYHHNEVVSACVDVIPLLLGTVFDLQINDDDLIISSSPTFRDEKSGPEPAVCIQHIPTGISIQSSGERSRFANKVKALNRLKAKLLVIAEEQKVSDLSTINRDDILDVWQKETRRYLFHPCKLVQDVKTGIQLADLNSVLDGNIEPLIAAHINTRTTD